MIDRSGVIKIVVLIHSLMGGGLANATDLVVNNGLAPPAPSNVFSTDLVSIDHIHVQDVGCDVTVLDPCATPGLSTTIETLSGALILEIVSHQTSRLVLTGGNIIEAQARDQSAIDLNGASVFGMHTFDDARVVMADGGLLSIDARDRSDAHFASGFIGGAGILMGEFVARDSASITLAGGTSDPMDRYLAYGAGTITFIGSNFRVDGSSVPYGPIAAQTGTLTGTFESGAAIDNPFYQGGSASPVCQPGPCTGTIILARGEAVPSMAAWGRGTLVLAMLAATSPTRTLRGRLRRSRRKRVERTRDRHSGQVRASALHPAPHPRRESSRRAMS